jgi:DHA2 family multidrug resistance protein
VNAKAHDTWQPKYSPWLVGCSVALAAFMSMLDSSVANVSLSHIAGNLSSTSDEATWVLTSYMVTAALVLASSAWLSSYFGRKKYIMFSVALFTVSSMLCGMAQSLPQLILARILQGLGGGAVEPLSQAILLESFPKEKRGSAMAVFGVAMMFAPMIGPTLGGWITDNYSWRWIFYINVPIGALTLLLQSIFVEDPPYLARSRHVPIDYIGLALMVAAIGTLQIVLDKGQEMDWFGSAPICWGAAVVLVTLPLFIWRELSCEHPLLNLSLLKNRNLAVAGLMMILMSVCLFAGGTLIPMFMQNMLGYPAMQCGFAMMPRGAGTLLSLALVGGLLDGKLDRRALMTCGFVLTGISCVMCSGFYAGIARTDIVIPQFLNGFGCGFIFIPISVLGVGGLERHDINQGTAVMELLQNIGGSIGISIMFAYQARMAQVHQVYLVSHISAASPVFQHWAGQLHSLAKMHAPVFSLVYAKVLQQASMLALDDSFRCLALISFMCIPLVLLFKKHRISTDAVAAGEGISI